MLRLWISMAMVAATSALAQLRPGEVPVEGLPSNVVKRVLVGWDAPTANEDGSPLTDLAGYRVYWGATSGVYSAVSPLVPAETNAPPAEGVTTGLYAIAFTNRNEAFLAVTALDTSGNESDFSEELHWLGNVPGRILRLDVEESDDLSATNWTGVGFFRLRIRPEGGSEVVDASGG